MPVIPSKQTVDEINQDAQARLEARRKERLATEHYLFGAPKKVKEPHGKVVFT
jgi:hypothetical protein